MRDALDTWATLPLVTILPKHKSMMVVLLNNIIDLASIMGFPKVIASAQKCMFALLEPTERKKNLARLWEWRRISHDMCASPVNKIFIDVLSKYCGEASRGVDFWIDSLEEPALIVGWKHNFSYTFSALCCNKPNLNSTDLKSFHGEVTIGEAAATASACSMYEDYSTDDSSIEGSSIDYRSKYMAAYLYYDLCERLAANGRLIDALPCASLAAGIRLELYTKIFDEKSQEYEMCICNKKGCWQCIPLDVMNSGLVQNFVDLKCKFVCRRLCLGLLARSGNHCENHEMSNNILQRTSILLNRDQVLDTSVNDWESYLPLLVNDVPGDSLSIERAELLHYIYCWKIPAHEPSHDFVQEDELLLLLQAFVLCREVPELFQKAKRAEEAKRAVLEAQKRAANEAAAREVSEASKRNQQEQAR